jgi:hypothetical protein
MPIPWVGVLCIRFCDQPCSRRSDYDEDSEKQAKFPPVLVAPVGGGAVPTDYDVATGTAVLSIKAVLGNWYVWCFWVDYCDGGRMLKINVGRSLLGDCAGLNRLAL